MLTEKVKMKRNNIKINKLVQTSSACDLISIGIVLRGPKKNKCGSGNS